MARLAAIAKTLYYPTQDRVLSFIIDKVKPNLGGWIYDPCCGEGHAISALARAWKMKSVGVELDPERYDIAKEQIDHCFLGSIHQVKAKFKASVLFLNPPYDVGQEGRQEIEFLRRAIENLAYEGLLIYIVPGSLVENSSALNSILENRFKEIVVVRYPDPEWKEFKQVIILAQKSRKNDYFSGRFNRFQHGWKTFESFEDPEGVYDFQHSGPYLAETPKGEFSYFDLTAMDPEAVRPSWDSNTVSGAYKTPAWEILVARKDSDFLKPLMAPRTGHRAMMLVSGALNGLEVGGKIIKGRSVKTSIEVGRTPDSENSRKEIVTYRETIDSVISEIDPKEGTFSSWNAREDQERTKKWFEENGSFLTGAIETAFTPQFDGNTSSFDFSRFKAPGTLPGQLAPRFLEVQKSAAVAIHLRWKTYTTVILSGELGTGKTTISLLALGLTSQVKKAVVVCPSHLIPKWLREANNLFQTPGIAVTAKKISQIDDFFSRERRIERALLDEVEPKILILSKETAKLGAKWQTRTSSKLRWGFDGSNKVKVYVPSCPDCGHVFDPEFREDLNLNKTKKYCPECKSALWQSESISSRGTKRWPLASYIRHRYGNQYHLILDEAHSFSKSETDQARAVQVLASGAKKILVMTGTLYGGRASSLFHLVYKVDPRFRDMYEFTDARKFSEQHGLFEKVFKEDENTSRYGYRRGQTGGRLKEIPGVSPTMINLLLHYTIFVKLKDLGLDLPGYSETVEILDNDPEVDKAVSKLTTSLKQVLKKYPSALGAYLMACLGYPDCPEHAEQVSGKDSDGYEVLLGTAPSIIRESLPKDQRLLEIIQENKKEGRKVLVYFSQTEKRSAIPRLKVFLEKNGVKIEHLTNKVKAEEREAWLTECQKRDFDVLFTNGRLVETGLDLLFAKTIVQYGIEFSINTLRQSIRRSWRLGQDKDIRVIFLAYRAGLQAAAMSLISKKMQAAEMLDGDDIFGGLSQYDGDVDFLLELAQEALRR